MVFKMENTERRRYATIDMGINNSYLEKFVEIRKGEGAPAVSYNQYVSRAGQLMRHLNRDIMTITADELQYWLAAGNEAKKGFIKGFMYTMLKHDINNSRDKVTRDILLYFAIN
jgi:hypothetical protein